MSYGEALRSAMAGKLDLRVISAFRTEHAAAAAERSGSTLRRVNAKNNLASALLNMANAAASPAEYVSMYQESEELLLAALKLQPSNADAKLNLEVVHKNRSKRPGVKLDAAPTAGKNRAHDRKLEHQNIVDKTRQYEDQERLLDDSVSLRLSIVFQHVWLSFS
jgi:hypothetical protein